MPKRPNNDPKSVSKKILAFGDAPLTTSAKGAAGELLVSVDLLKRGFFVFRSVSPTAPYDLIACNSQGKLFRIECRCGVVQKSSGKIYFNRTGSTADHYAVILTDKVLYEPPLED